VIGLYLLVAIEATSLAMRRLPRPAWRAVHLTSYGLVWLVSLHAGLAGSDTANIAYRAVALLLTAGAVAATTVRLATGARAQRRRTVPSAPSGRPPAVPTR
jgi:DMSO/TMAO reductase YedYZ heme-binding membrane subunit